MGRFQNFIYLASLCAAEDNYRVKNDVEHFIYVEEYLIISSKSPRSKYHCVKIDVFASFQLRMLLIIYINNQEE